ncbi:hypothetical protein ABPG72_016266 [Tetrahymena utriculariae]
MITIKSLNELTSTDLVSSNNLSVSLNNMKIGNQQITVIADSLKQCQNLNSLTMDLSLNQIDGSAVIDLVFVLKENSNLTKLNLCLSKNQVCDSGASLIGQHIKDYPNLTDLILNLKQQNQFYLFVFLFKQKKSNNRIGDQGTYYLISNLKQCESLSTLELQLSFNKLGDQGVSQMLPQFKQCQNLQKLKLVLNNNQIKDFSINYLVNELSQCEKLKNLQIFLEQQFFITYFNKTHFFEPKISSNWIGDQLTYKFMQGIKLCQNITHLILTLTYCKIGNEGAKQLASQLKLCLHLSNLVLNLEYNNIQNEGAYYLGMELKQLQSLTHFKLGMSSNEIEEEGAIQLITQLRQCLSLSSLDIYLSHIKISDNSAAIIAQTLKQYPQLISLTLGLAYCSIKQQGAISFATELAQLQHLTALKLGFLCNQIGDLGSVSISNALRSLVKLKILEVNFGNNMMSVSAKLSFYRKLYKLKRLILIQSIKNQNKGDNRMEISWQSLDKLIKNIQKDKNKLVYRQKYDPKYINHLRKTNLQNSRKKAKSKRRVKRLIIGGHRGVGMFEAHNSISSFNKSIGLHQDYVELDTWLTTDSVVVVVHGVDGKIKDKDGNLKLIESFSSEEITSIVINDKNDKIPTLEEIFQLCKNKIKINIELKGTNLTLPEAVVALIKKHSMEDEVYLSAFYHPFYQLSLDAQKKHSINTFIKFGFLFCKEDQFPDLSKIPEGNQLNFSSVLAYNEEAVKFLVQGREKGLTLCAYFGFDILETHSLYKRLIQIGCTSLITNQPHTLKNFRLKYLKY